MTYMFENQKLTFWPFRIVLAIRYPHLNHGQMSIQDSDF